MRITAQQITVVSLITFAATSFWGLAPNYKAWQSAQRQLKTAQTAHANAQASLGQVKQRYRTSPVDLSSVPATLARLIELTHVAPYRHGVTVSQLTPASLGRSNSGMVPIERLTQSDSRTGLAILTIQIKGNYMTLNGLYDFMDAVGPASGMAVQSFEATAKHFVLTVVAYASPKP